ncbi:VOC family protein [Microbacterium sp. zg.B48]|uniref:VOC family protein n=1 Tax=Microbacterium sp. zg.B48 TaxID=2969408 RepID=UPI00214C644F|nr:VOC family protein [Microbacterium sp. zg.B48]MCR2762634.1 VOC family protein [Microbacterium sp. zg.B48]
MAEQRMRPRTYPAGVPCWVDATQSDVRAGAAFYGALFDWDFAAAGSPGAGPPYLFAQRDGLDVGGLGPTASGRPTPAWISHIACDDIVDACLRIERAGGLVAVPPAEYGPYGRGALCADPQGAVFGLWKGRTHPGSQIVNVPGAWNFSDLRTPDPEAALAFYGDVFGWQADADFGAGMIRLPGYGDHLASTIDPGIRERQAFAPAGFADVIAGLTVDPDASGATWEIRFTVADRDASAGTAERLGATVASRTDGEWTRDAVIVDPQGARLVVSQFAPPDAAGF